MTEDVVIGSPGNLLTGVIKAIRPRQWVKNVIVLAAPLAALGGPVRYDYAEVLTKVSVAFVVFCLAASSIYLVNDARDVDADREHPTKRFRPIAAGVVPEWLAYTLAVVLGAASLAIAWWLTPNLALVMAVYIGMQLGYCFGLKHQAVMDICIVSSAYLIRAIAGGAATKIPLSQWFLLFVAFGSLFMVAGKRYAELQVAGLVHDIGHLLTPGAPAEHGRTGGDWLRRLLGERVAALVELHVDAKRYLVAVEPGYRSRLSVDSIFTLVAQGGALSPFEAAAFERRAHSADALVLRVADEAAKIPGLEVPGLNAWTPLLHSVADHRQGSR
jgi:predicted HD phosphohydrolase